MGNPYLQNREIQTEEIIKKDDKNKKNKKALRCVLAVAVAFVCFFAGLGACWLSLDPEMRSLIRLKGKLQDEYYQEITDEDFYGTLFGAINGKLLDDYSAYMTAEEYEAILSAGRGNNSGIGVSLVTQTSAGEDCIFIRRVCGNSPAEKSGLVEGDYILGFGKTESQITETMSYQKLAEFMDAIPQGENFYLKIRSENGAEKTVSIYKENYLENCVFYRSASATYRFTGDDKGDKVEVGKPLRALPASWAYIRLTQFNENASDEFEGAMEFFKEEGKKNLLLDLRGNGGGYLDVAQDIASYFCKSATNRRPIMAIADYGEDKEYFKASGNEYYEYFSSESRICVLADNESASASECLLGCMLDYGAVAYADICLSYRFGVAKTFGKGIMQTTYPIRIFEGDAVRLTTATIHWPLSNRCIHGRGILPEDGTKTVAESYTDKEIENALSALGI